MGTIATFHIAEGDLPYWTLLGAILSDGYPFELGGRKGGVSLSILQAKNPKDFRKAVAEFFLDHEGKEDVLTVKDMLRMSSDGSMPTALSELNPEFTYTFIEGSVIVVGEWRVPLLLPKRMREKSKTRKSRKEKK